MGTAHSAPVRWVSAAEARSGARKAEAMRVMRLRELVVSILDVVCLQVWVRFAARRRWGRLSRKKPRVQLLS